MATKKTKAQKPNAKIQLVESDSKTPTIQARPGVRIEIVAISSPAGVESKIGARLCGYGSGSCLALVETD